MSEAIDGRIGGSNGPPIARSRDLEQEFFSLLGSHAFVAQSYV